MKEAQGVTHIQLLGGFRVTVGENVVSPGEWRLRKASQLVKLLALEPGHRLHREQLVDQLWPDLDPAAASNNFHRSLHAARRALESAAPNGLGSTLLRLQGGFLLLGSPDTLTVDVAAFEAAAHRARSVHDPAALEAAIDMYAGPLLPEDQYEDWAAARREALHETYLELLIELAIRYESDHRYGRAIKQLERVVAAEPAHEHAHVGLMRLYAVSGQRHQALRQYQELRDALRQELDVEPDDDSQRLYQAILTHRFSDSSPRIERPVEPLEIRRSNLPIALTRFIGRQRDLAQIGKLFERSRLLTLTGPGGGGKTRLALELTSRLVQHYKDGVWLVDLAPLADPSLVAPAIARVLDIREAAERPLLQSLTNALRHREMLLTLDNCEHVVERCAEVAQALLSACPHLKIIATSREPLQVTGEVIWRVPPMRVPEPDASPTIGDLSQYEAAELFLQQAQLRQPGMALTDENAAAIAEICRRLDGLPLAIELAAARVPALNLAQIVERLPDNLQILSANSRTGAERHRTLRATLDWSYGLLSEAERQLLNRLSVFAGGWTLEAAEAICGGCEVERREVLALLEQLIDKSMVMVDEHVRSPAMRYRLLQTIRQYATERLSIGGETETIRKRHTAYFLRLAEVAEPHLARIDNRGWWERIMIELDNLRAAFDGAVERRELEAALRLPGMLWQFWLARGYLQEGRSWLTRALELAVGSEEAVNPAALAKAHHGAGVLACWQGDYQPAGAHLQASLRLQREAGDKAGMASSLNYLGNIAYFQVDYMSAAAYYAESLALRRELGDRAATAYSLNNLGILASAQREFARAEALLEESLDLNRELNDRWGMAYTLDSLGYVALAQRETYRACAWFGASLRLLQELGDKVGIVACVEGLARTAAAGSEPEQAARLFGALEVLRTELGAPLGPKDLPGHQQAVASIRAQLDDDAFGRAWTQGQSLSLDETIQAALGVADITAPAPRS